MLTALYEKLTLVVGLIVAMALSFFFGWMMHRRSVRIAPLPAGIILAQAPRAEERSADNKSVTLKRSVADSGVIAWSRTQRPKAEPIRAAEILAETQTGDKINLKLVETKENDGTERITVTSDDGKIITGTDWTMPVEPIRDERPKRWGVFALARSDFASRPNYGAGITYRRGPIVAFVGGFRKEAIAGIGIQF